MLVLTRKSGESIRIGEGIVVTILDGNGNQVKVGISAPRELSIHREEVYQRIKEENLASAAAGESATETLMRAAQNLPKPNKEQP